MLSPLDIKKIDHRSNAYTHYVWFTMDNCIFFYFYLVYLKWDSNLFMNQVTVNINILISTHNFQRKRCVKEILLYDPICQSAILVGIYNNLKYI